jgi:hypothetical protein
MATACSCVWVGAGYTICICVGCVLQSCLRWLRFGVGEVMDKLPVWSHFGQPNAAETVECTAAGVCLESSEKILSW